MMMTRLFNTGTKEKKRARLYTFFNTNWLLVLLLMIGCVVGCKKDNEVVGKVGTCPTVLSTNPINGAINVVTDQKISATFNEHMNMSSINTSTFQLRHGINQVLGTVSVVGSTATFTPVDALLANTVYTATITSGVVDSANTALPVSYIWSFNTGSTPTVVLTDPTNGASDVPFGKLVTATFSTTMNPSTISSSTYIVKQGSINIPGTVSYTGMVATFTPSIPLLPKTVYTGTIMGTAADLLGNIMAVDYVWSFSTGAVPAVVATDPTNSSINVVLDKKISATFNKIMDATTINVNNFTITEGNSSVAGTISYNGKTAMFIPTNPLDMNAVYVGTITTDTKDSAGNNLPANYTWTFTTGNAPIVISTDPTNGATNVALNKVITASFSTAMDPTTINGSTFIVKQGANVIAGTVTYVGTSAVFAPTNPLNPSTVYTGTITTGAKDKLGNALGNNYTFSFTTTSLPPTVISTDPANAATNVPLNKLISATFSTVMDATTINVFDFQVMQGLNQVFGTVSYVGKTATFTPATPLISNTLYTCTITTGAKDASGNPLLTNYVWNFTSVPVIVIHPSVTSTVPLNLATNVAITSSIMASFSMSMDPLTLSNATFTLQQGGNNVLGAVTYSGTTATFFPLSNLNTNTKYTATITTNAKNLAGVGLANDYVWTFTTALPVNPPPSLGSAAIFGAFGGNAGVTNQGINTVINGSIGSTGASTLITGFHDGTTGDVYTETPLNIGDVTGRIYTAPPFPGTASSMTIAQNALADATATYNTISPAGTPGGSDPGAGELGGLTLAPGVYQAAGGTFKITNGNLTLDAKGDANAVWIFQTASALTVGIAGPAGARSVVMINGGKPKNVFWYVGSAAVINGAGGGIMSGTIIASAGVTVSTAGNTVQTVLNGRAISLNGSVTMVNTTVNVQ